MNNAETELLISLVKPNPCLYDPSHDDYKHAEIKESVWQEIATAMNKNVNTLRSDWKKLRDCHRDAMKRRLFPQTEKDAKINKKWKYEDQMEFLLNFMTNRRGHAYADPNATSNYTATSHTTNATSTDDQNSDDGDTAGEVGYSPGSEDEPPSKSARSSYFTRKSATTVPAVHDQDSSASYTDINNLTNLLSTQSSYLANEMELFFSAMCATTKRLPVRYQMKIKKEIFAIVTQNEEAAYEHEQQMM